MVLADTAGMQDNYVIGLDRGNRDEVKFVLYFQTSECEEGNKEQILQRSGFTRVQYNCIVVLRFIKITLRKSK